MILSMQTPPRPHTRAIFLAALSGAVMACASASPRALPHPIPEQRTPPAATPELRGTDDAAAALSGEENLAICRELVRAFYRPVGHQARWIDPRPLPNLRRRDADALTTPDAVRAQDIADAIALSHVCPVDDVAGGCTGRSGGILRFSPAYAGAADSVVLFVRYTPATNGRVSSGEGSEIAFQLQHGSSRWRIVKRWYVPAT